MHFGSIRLEMADNSLGSMPGFTVKNESSIPKGQRFKRFILKVAGMLRMLSRDNDAFIINKTPDVVYRTATDGGAMILDKYPRAEKEEKSKTATSGTAPILELQAKKKEKAKPGQRRPAASEVQCIA